MGKFFEENWLYILLPILLVAAVILYLVLSSGNSDQFTGYPL